MSEGLAGAKRTEVTLSLLRPVFHFSDAPRATRYIADYYTIDARTTSGAVQVGKFAGPLKQITGVVSITARVFNEEGRYQLISRQIFDYAISARRVDFRAPYGGIDAKYAHPREWKSGSPPGEVNELIETQLNRFTHVLETAFMSHEVQPWISGVWQLLGQLGPNDEGDYVSLDEVERRLKELGGLDCEQYFRFTAGTFEFRTDGCS